MEMRPGLLLVGLRPKSVSTDWLIYGISVQDFMAPMQLGLINGHFVHHI